MIDVVSVLDYEIATIPISTEDFGPQRLQDIEDLGQVRSAVVEVLAAAKEAERDAFVTEAGHISLGQAEWARLILALEGLRDAR